MKHQTIIGSAVSLTFRCLLILCISATSAFANTKADELQRKIADIGLLKQQLEDRRKQAESILSALIQQQRELAAEIRLIRKSYGVETYQQAKKHERAYYNVELLRTIVSYRHELNQKLKIYHTGINKLMYLQQMAEDDIRMIRTLDDFEIDALTTQISLVISQYLKEAHIIQIDPKNIIKFTPPDTLWVGIVNGTY